MAHFNSSLFKALAHGPGAKISVAGNRQWTEEQKQQLEDSKTALYEVVMLRAARLLEVTYQDDNPGDEMRVAQVPLTITITSEAADRDQNGADRNNHKIAHPRIEKEIRATRDAGLDIDFSYLDDEATKLAIVEFRTVGLACP